MKMRDMNYLLSIKHPGRAISSRRQFAQDLGEFDGARAAFCASALKIDPAFVETVKHTYAGFGMLHAFPAESLLPLGARNFHRFHIAAKSSSEGGVAINVLNKGLRPFLAKWHPALKSWEATGTPEDSWPEREQFRSELAAVGRDLSRYAEVLAAIAGVGNQI
jgi:hypothetical protein